MQVRPNLTAATSSHMSDRPITPMLPEAKTESVDDNCLRNPETCRSKFCFLHGLDLCLSLLGSYLINRNVQAKHSWIELIRSLTLVAGILKRSGVLVDDAFARSILFRQFRLYLKESDSWRCERINRLCASLYNPRRCGNKRPCQSCKMILFPSCRSIVRRTEAIINPEEHAESLEKINRFIVSCGALLWGCKSMPAQNDAQASSAHVRFFLDDRMTTSEPRQSNRGEYLTVTRRKMYFQPACSDTESESTADDSAIKVSSWLSARICNSSLASSISSVSFRSRISPTASWTLELFVPSLLY